MMMMMMKVVEGIQQAVSVLLVISAEENLQNHSVMGVLEELWKEQLLAFHLHCLP